MAQHASDLVDRIYHETGTQGKPRVFSNNLLFLVADKDEKEKMEIKAREFLALKKLCEEIDAGSPAGQAYSQTQKERLKEKRKEAELFLKVAIVVAHKWLFLPTTQKDLNSAQGRKPLRKLQIRATDAEVESGVRTNRNQEDGLVEYLKNQSAVRTADDNPWVPEFVLDELWPKNTASLNGDEFKRLFYKNPSADLVLTEHLIGKAQEIGVKGGKWYAILGNQFYDKTNASTFPAMVVPELRLVLSESDEGRGAWEQFNCPRCRKRRTACSCDQQSCPTCGKALTACICNEPRCPKCGRFLKECKGFHPEDTAPLLVEDRTMDGILHLLEPMLEDRKVESVFSLELKAGSRDDLAKLASALPQFLGAQIKFQLHAVLTKEHLKGNFVEVRYRGDAKGFQDVRGVLLNFDPKEAFSEHDLRITFTWEQGLPRDDLVKLLRGKVAQFLGTGVYTARVTPNAKPAPVGGATTLGGAGGTGGRP